MIAGVPNTGVVVVTLADSGLIGSISWVRSNGSEWLFSPATGDMLRGGTESANFWPTTERWTTSGSCDWWWNRDVISVGLSVNTLPELRSETRSLSLSTAHTDTTTTSSTHRPAQRNSSIAGSAPGTLCMMDSSSLGSRHHLGHDTIHTMMQWRHLLQQYRHMAHYVKIGCHP